MPPQHLNPGANGEMDSLSASTGERHTFIARRLVLDHRYHDDDPVQGATFVVKFGDGQEVSGKLDAQGRATLLGVPDQVEVCYGPDTREYARADARENADHRPSMSEADCEKLIEKYRT